MPHEAMYRQLAETIGAGDSPTVPKIFELLATEDEARVVLAASPPATANELGEKTGVSVEAVEKMVGPLFTKGLIFKSVKPDGTRYYRAKHLLQFRDATVLAPGAPKALHDLWREYHQKEFKAFHTKLESTMPRSALRVIPVNAGIEFDSQIAPFEDVTKIVERADNLAVTPCACRLFLGACGKPLEVCIQVNRAADYAIERGSGRKVSKEEALEKLRLSEQEGLVHTVGNTRGLGHIICNCCDDCCINWPGPRTAASKYCAPSRFAALVDADACIGCETCLDRCYFSAIEVDGGVARIVEQNCMGCGLCATTCPVEALSMKEVRNEGFVPE
jgi:Pyruvate/2-oxoacid:ferredoxin oxidoreductase delta subunit